MVNCKLVIAVCLPAAGGLHRLCKLVIGTEGMQAQGTQHFSHVKQKVQAASVV